ncbi:VWA domain-containing protein [Candidatus Sumerlaeota bacterium]|nr:VWA domain-containing protein [Candidatus Sumerlaeota bacterium]
MSFINPLALLFGLLGGLIVLMYLLKLKRKKEFFSSTLLWIKSMEDLTANAPFQKLRQNLLMYLQILLLLLLALSLARPTMWLSRKSGASTILLIDNTASMNATDGSPTRLAEAKLLARQLVGNMTPGDRMMIVTFGGAARVAQAFTPEKGLLYTALAGIQPTDGESKVLDALLIVQGVRKIDKNVALTIISDGGVGYLGNLIGEKDKDPVRFIKVGKDGGAGDDNRAIVAFDVRESFEKRGEAQVFAEVENFSSAPNHVMLRCLVDGQLEQVKEENVDPRGKIGFVFSGLDGSRKSVQLEITGKDLLESDDIVRGVLNLDTTTRILLVTNGNFFLEKMLALIPGAKVVKVDPASYDPKVAWDVVVFDQFSPKELGAGNYLFINCVPSAEGFKKNDQSFKDQITIDWNRLHPITRFINFEPLIAGDALNIEKPDWMQSLVESAECPLIIAGERSGLKIVCVTFDLYATDWPLQVGYPIFMTNAIQWLASASGSNLAAGHHTGETITIQGNPKFKESISVEDPDGKSFKVDTNESLVGYFNETLKVGIYRINQGTEKLGEFAVNLLSRMESDVAPKNQIVSGEQKVTATSVTRENR